MCFDWTAEAHNKKTNQGWQTIPDIWFLSTLTYQKKYQESFGSTEIKILNFCLKPAY